VNDSWSTLGLDLLLDVDPASPRRIGLERALRDAIRAGRLAPNTRLPSSRALAAELGVARGTVAAVYDQLVAEGQLAARRGSGTLVAALADEPPRGVAPEELAPGLPMDLRPGSPDVTTFPTVAWARATRRALGSAPFTAYGYGDPRGRIELRTALSRYLARTRGVVARPQQIVITAGYQQGLSLVTTVSREIGGRDFAMEDPGLAFHREVVARSGHRVLPLPVDEQGARTDLLATATYSAAGTVVVTPAHQYPTGVTMHPLRRHALAAWARSNQGLVVEDDYDGEFRYDRQPVGALQGMAPDHVVYIGSASKTLGPAVRLGWMVLPPSLVGPVIEAKRFADYQTESVGQLTLADLISSHDYDRHVRSCRLHYRRRRDSLVERLQSHEARTRGVVVRGIAAGLQTLVDLPLAGPGEPDVVSRAAASGLALSGLQDHWHRPGHQPPAIVVGFATPPQHLFHAATRILADVLLEPADTVTRR
jgi:GntR family transcriptional regulator / MocR family aminotransferase